MIKKFLYKVKNNQLLFFITKTILFLLIVLILDFAIGNLLSYFYFKQESGLQYRTTYSIEKTTADVLIFGSSRANHHYKPEVFEKELNLNYYNVGRDGSSILYHYAVLNAILKRYIPKMIILDLNDSEFRQSQETYERLSSLLPYYRKHPEIRSIIELRSKYEKYKLYSSIYPYNSVLSTIIIGNTKRNKERKGDNLGYIPLNMTWTEEIKINNNEEKYPIDSLKVKMFLGFVTKCKSANIRLYVVFSPFYVKYIREDYSVKLAKEITKKYNIIFFDYSNDSTFITKKSFFADFGHLNDQGAKFFSKKIIEQIKKTSSIKATN